MEDILAKLLVDDSAIIAQGTAELREVLKNPESTPTLCQIVVSSVNPEIRQYAGVLLRKKFIKAKYWSKLPVNIRTEIKSIILGGLVNEQEKMVKNTIAQLIGAIVKHELSNNTWPELFQFIQQVVASNNILEKELGMYILSKMTEVAPEIYLAHAQSLMTLLAQTYASLQQQYGNDTGYYIVKTMENLSPLVEGNQIMVNAYNEMVPLAILTIQALIENNNDKALYSMELFYELFENAITVVSPHIKNIILMCLIVAKNTTLEDELRVKSIEVISCLARTKTRAIVKNKLVEPIVDVLFELLSSKPDDENDENYFAEDDDDITTSLVTIASEALHTLATNLNPDKLLPHLLKHIEPNLQTNNNYAKKASYLSLAVLAEGCAEYIRTKYLEDFLRCICQGISNQSPVVRNAALFALGQFSEHLQPEISQYAQQLLPVLFDYLGQMCEQLKQGNNKTPSADRMFFALEIFCENLNDGLLPYLPTLMDRLFVILETEASTVHLRELALSAISASSNASKENMLPYFPKIMSILDIYLVNTNNEFVREFDDDDPRMESNPNCLLVQSLDTLGVLARTIGEKNFSPFITKSMNLSITLLTEVYDPDVRKSIYGLLASLALLTKKEMAPVLPQILDYIINSMQSSDGVVTYYKDDAPIVNSQFTVYEDLDEKENEDEEDIENTDNEDDNDDDDADDDVAGYSVINSYIEEKEEAILALREIAHWTEEAFMPYIEKSFEETFKLISYPQDSIRKASIEALAQFCINLSKINTQDGKIALLKALGVYVPKLSEIIRLDDDLSVVITAIEGLTELLKEIKEPVVIAEGHKDAIMNCISDVFNGKVECQDQDECECDDDEAEQDEYLIECTGDLMANFGKTIIPDEFALFFQKTLPFLKNKIKDSKSDSQRSFAVGTIAECLGSLKHNIVPFVPQLYQLFKKCLDDHSPEVRNNAYYGIGELVYHGKECLYPTYNEILQLLASNLPREDSPGPRDNMTGIIARLIITNHSLVDVERVFPVFVQQLPLKQDFEEYKAVFKCILTLYQSGNEIIKPHIQTFLKISICLLHEKQIENEETKSLVVEFINSCQRDFSNEWAAVLSELSPEIQQTFSS
ncbi:hypothetical protein HCN44_001303 [Aphidius gifuensis]|uniref:Importin N-terminal domain-containing protein n=1 Tax=Aphidius gifuensis TaxID=684658 RepID=A0A835CQ25_APHGI|nr:importin-4-like [Aphidius gifuensis]KAF7988730.1 hypothetical protein HCN44_001303 [Aphidius gifuensis]